MSCVTDSAYISAATKQGHAIVTQATVDAAIQVAIALWQRNSSTSISNMQKNISEQQVVLAEAVQAHAVIFWAEEADLVNDAFGVSKVVTGYTALSSGWAALVDEAEAEGRALWLDVSRQLCLPPDRCQDARWQRNEQLLRADMLSYASRQDEARTETLNDRRYARQLAVLGMGQGKVADLVTYQNIGLYSGLSAASMLESGINSAMQLYGYQSSRTGPPTGWAQGIKQTWTAAPNFRSTVTMPATDAQRATVTVLPPVPTRAAPTTKANEIQAGFDIVEHPTFTLPNNFDEARRLDGGIY
jgi:hypothetical protein